MVEKLTIVEAIEPFLNKLGQSIHLANICKELNQPHPTVRLKLNTLLKYGVLKKTYKGRLTLYSLNLDHPNLIDYLTIAEKNKLILKCQKELLFREIVKFLREQDCLNSAIIFGSAVYNLKKANDVDVLIVGKVDNKKFNDFSNKINKKLHIITLTNFNDVSVSLKKEILTKHLIVAGTEQVLRWLL